MNLRAAFSSACQVSSRVFYHHINSTAFLDIEFIPLPGQVLAYYHWCSSMIQISIIFRRVSVTSAVICADKVLSISLDTYRPSDADW